MKRNLPSKVSNIIRERILDFSLPPGGEIPDLQIAQEMKISRKPVIEALNTLCVEGIVDAVPYRGFIVKGFEPKEVEDIYLLRARLETLAVELTIVNFSQAKQKELEGLLEKSSRYIEKNDLSGFNDLDERFHDLIARHSENSDLYKVLKNIRGKIRLIRRYDHLRFGRLEAAHKNHCDILNLIIQKDVKGAAEKMSEHIILSMKYVLNFMSENKNLYTGLYNRPGEEPTNR